jgi:hypothetical protein
MNHVATAGIAVIAGATRSRPAGLEDIVVPGQEGGSGVHAATG